MSDSHLTIVAIHGNGGGSFRFSFLMEHIPKHVNFVAVTLPGFAGVPLNHSVSSVEDLAEILHEELCGSELPEGWLSSQSWTSLEKRPFILLGTGIGGSIALQYAQKYAHYLAGLILHAPVGTRLDTRWFPRLMSLPINRKIGKMVFTSSLIRPFWRKVLFTKPLPKEEETQFFDEYRQCQLFGELFDWITPEWFNTLKPVAIPAALLWGERERVLTVDQLDDYKALLLEPIIHTEPDWDHFPMLDTPKQFVEVLTSLSLKISE